MTEDQRKALVADLVKDVTNFDLALSDECRKWFVDRVIRSLEAATPPLDKAVIQARTRDVVSRAKAIAKAKASIKLKIPVEMQFPAWYGAHHSRRIETIYGAIAFDPSLVETANDKYLDLVIRRRYRALARMELWVNAISTFPLFQYQDSTCSTLRINQAAVPLWNVATPHSDGKGGTLPRWTIKSTGSTAMTPAVDALWQPVTAQCEGNVLECATAMSTVLIDSLLETKDPNAFLGSLSSHGPRFLAICNPLLPDAIPNFIFDVPNQRAFKVEHADIKDLQIGDYVYFQNHPLYEVFEPFGVWHGEHAVVSALRSKDPLTGIKITGHGVAPTDIATLQSKLLKGLNSYISLLFAATSEFLRYLEGTYPSPDVVTDQAQIMIEGRMEQVDFYLFNRALSWTNFETQPIQQDSLSAFLIVHAPNRHELGLHRTRDLAAAKQNPGNLIPVYLAVSVAPPGDLNIVNWGVPFVPAGTNAQVYWPLAARDSSNAVCINYLRQVDMPSPPLAHERGKTGVLMVQPQHKPTPPGAI